MSLTATGECRRCNETYRLKLGALNGYCSTACRLAAEAEEREIRHTTCPTCGSRFNPRDRNYWTRYCSDGCVPGGRDPYAVFERDGFRCVYCGLSSVEDGVKLHADHIVPKSAGGDDLVTNLVTACKSCNCSKGARRLAPDVETRLLELVAERTTDEFLYHVRRRDRFA